jgi:hypothetical protein
MSTYARKPPGRPARGPKRSTSETSLTSSDKPTVFSSKDVFEFLAARVAAAMEDSSTVVYKGEQRAWGSTRPFNPVIDDFLQIVQAAVDEFNQSKQ